MGGPIVKLEGSYLVWSTVSDAPVAFGMTRDELEAWHRDEYGRHGAFAQRMERVDTTGTSFCAYGVRSAEDTIWLNRAGPNEARLHREEIVEFYVRRHEAPTAEALAEMREGAVACSPCGFADGGRFCACWGSGVRYPGKDPA